MIVFGLGKNLLFKSVLGHCEIILVNRFLIIQFGTLSNLYSAKLMYNDFDNLYCEPGRTTYKLL